MKKHILRQSAHRIAAGVMMVWMASVLTGCMGHHGGHHLFGMGNVGETLKGVWAWRQGKMQKAVAAFLHVLQSEMEAGNKDGAQYALYNAAAIYVAMGEYSAAQSRLDDIAEDAPSCVQYASAYNKGMIVASYGEYGKAAEYFKAALTADSGKVEAKANLEIVNAALQDMAAMQAEMAVAESVALPSNAAAENAILERIREQDKKQWINKEQSASRSGAVDY